MNTNEKIMFLYAILIFNLINVSEIILDIETKISIFNGIYLFLCIGLFYYLKIIKYLTQITFKYLYNK